MVTYLEMRSLAEFRAAPPAAGLRLEPIDNHAALLRDIVVRVGAPHQWSSVRDTPEQWQRAMDQPGLRHWLIMIDDQPAGVVGLHIQSDGDVEITEFGLVPELVGHGYGGSALSEAVRMAWAGNPEIASTVHRVWLHTSSLDHPHALHNYTRRGFRPFRTAQRDEPD